MRSWRRRLGVPSLLRYCLRATSLLCLHIWQASLAELRKEKALMQTHLEVQLKVCGLPSPSRLV